MPFLSHGISGYTANHPHHSPRSDCQQHSSYSHGDEYFDHHTTPDGTVRSSSGQEHQPDDDNQRGLYHHPDDHSGNSRPRTDAAGCPEAWHLQRHPWRYWRTGS
jgi:hypothetical protein